VGDESGEFPGADWVRDDFSFLLLYLLLLNDLTNSGFFSFWRVGIGLDVLMP
jgi:hypothetical protein